MRTKLANDTTLRLKGIEALNNKLGFSGALRFLTLLHRESTDYIKISKRLYKGQSIEEIFERARKNWKK